MPYSEMMLRAGVALLRGFMKPHGCFGIVHGNTLAAGIHHAEVELGQRMTLVGRLEVPDRGLRLIRRHAFAVGVFQPESKLRLGVAAVGLRLGGLFSRRRGTSK